MKKKEEITLDLIKKSSDLEKSSITIKEQYKNLEAQIKETKVAVTKAEIANDLITPAVNGNKPRRQADFIYNIVPTYKFGANKQHNFGFSVIGTTKSYAQENNKLVMPGYAYVNPFLSFELTKGLSATVNVNNVFDTIGITEVEEGSKLRSSLMKK